MSAGDLQWRSIDVLLPPAEHLEIESLQRTLRDASLPAIQRQEAARSLVWLGRCEAGEPVQVACLSIGRLAILHMPGELFVEYQLAAQRMRPQLFVAMAAYGDYAPAYIGTEIAYQQGGYETEPRSSRVAPQVERILMRAIDAALP